MIHLVGYRIGEKKYIKLITQTYPQEEIGMAIKQYRNLLEKHTQGDLILSLLDKDFNVLTAWPLGTPRELLPLQYLRLNDLEKNGTSLPPIGDQMDIEQLVGSQILEEIKDSLILSP